MSYAALVAPLFISGAGLGLAIPAVTKAVVGSVPPGDIGKASGVFSTMRQLGGAFGVAILAAVFTSAGSYASAGAFSDGFAPALAAAAGLALAGRAGRHWPCPAGGTGGTARQSATRSTSPPTKARRHELALGQGLVEVAEAADELGVGACSRPGRR